MSCLSLPRTAATEKYSHENHDFNKIAVYTLFETDRKSEDLQHALVQDPNVAQSYSMSHANIVDSTLTDVLNHHLEVAEQQNLHPTIFIVAHSQNYHEDGVLLIDANFDLKGSVGRCRVKVSLALLQAVNLQIGNIDWWDIEQEDQPAEEHSPVVNKKFDQTLTVFGAYGIRTGANMTKIRDLLEPGWLEKPAKSWLCESIGSYLGVSDPLEEVAKHHPWHCLRNSRMCKQWCICVDSTNPVLDGVLLLHIPWDGDTEKEPKVLLEIGATSAYRTERVDVGNALEVLAAKVAELGIGA